MCVCMHCVLLRKCVCTVCMTCPRCASTLTLLSSMTMNELLKQLIKKCKMEAQEGLRQLIGALNGLAGIFRIQMKVWCGLHELLGVLD